jgi:nicotinamide-nucleotide amidase
MKMEECKKAETLVDLLRKKRLTVTTAESCTGGLIAKLITDVAGSSAVFLGGVVSYTNEVKMALLGVDPAIIEEHTEVSLACAKAMAEGARLRLGSDLAVSTTGYAGPGGGTDKDPVGTVYIGVSTACQTVAHRFSAPDGADREEVREAAAERAMVLLLEHLEG